MFSCLSILRIIWNGACEDPKEAWLKRYLLLAFLLYSLLPRLVTYHVRKKCLWDKAIASGPWYTGIIKWPVPSDTVIKGNFLAKFSLLSVVQDWVPCTAQDRLPPVNSPGISNLWVPHQICMGVQSRLQDLLLLALNDSTETDPLMIATQHIV